MWNIFYTVSKSVNLLDQKNTQKRPQAPKPIFLGQESEKSENKIPIFDFFEKYRKFAHEISVHNRMVNRQFHRQSTRYLTMIGQ